MGLKKENVCEGKYYVIDIKDIGLVIVRVDGCPLNSDNPGVFGPAIGFNLKKDFVQFYEHYRLATLSCLCRAATKEEVEQAKAAIKQFHDNF